MNELEVYPYIWDDNEDEKDYLVHNFNDLKAFYVKAAGEGQAIINYITYEE
ncbi:YfbM family protein [Chitinophagaceae bacterium LB-8]|uniref:YfbM family protein n=1 Tax=Paraflavisolibacter caeni TaxID=2982496 RepID=A0A9X2XVC4_9BACT|nr:DUF1877 family protein [Paraflavisolibacter caeni]MCU7549077.1 YfbM family protein [Paraflavisolibacter caeni]